MDRHGNARLLAWDPERLVAIGAHDAAEVSHRRAVMRVGESALLVLDRLEGEGSHAAVQTWPLHPSDDVHEEAPGVIQASRGGAPRLWLAPPATGPTDVVVDSDAWWSRRLEAWSPAPRARQTVQWDGVTHLAALLVAPSHVGAAPFLELREAEAALVVRLGIGDSECVATVALAGESPHVQLDR